MGVGSAATQDDATSALSNNVVATEDHVARNKEDTQQLVETDVELEQQRMMNRVFNCPNLYSAAGPFTTVVQMVPVMVPNHQTGGYFVVQTTALSTGRTLRARPAAWWRWWTTSSWTSA